MAVLIFIFYDFLKLLHIVQQCEILHFIGVTNDLMILIHSTLVYKISMNNKSEVTKFILFRVGENYLFA
jgi:hypothetical protein